MDRTSWYTPLHISGTIEASAGGNRVALCEKIEEALTSFTSSWSGLPSWELYHEISGSPSFDKVFKHVGYRRNPTALHGNRSAYFRIADQGTTSIQLNNFGDWSILDQRGDYFASNQTASFVVSDTNEIKYWITANEYACAAIISASAGWRFPYFGEYREGFYTKPHQKMVAFLDQNASSGSGVVLSFDRAIEEGFREGGVYQVVNQTPRGESLVPAAISVVTASSVSGRTMTVSQLSNNHVSGSPVGIFPVRPIRNALGTATNGVHEDTFVCPIHSNGTKSQRIFSSEAVQSFSGELFITTFYDRMVYFSIPEISNYLEEESFGFMYFILVSDDFTNASNVSFLNFNGDFDQTYKCFSRFECNNMGTSYHTWLQVYAPSGSLGVI